jgi:hypothetical protein
LAVLASKQKLRQQNVSFRLGIRRKAATAKVACLCTNLLKLISSRPSSLSF